MTALPPQAEVVRRAILEGDFSNACRELSVLAGDLKRLTAGLPQGSPELDLLQRETEAFFAWARTAVNAQRSHVALRLSRSRTAHPYRSLGKQASGSMFRLDG
jgi:hypothetical protein